MKKVTLILSAVVMTAMALNSCGGGSSTEEISTKEVNIGDQVWMAENLNVDKFRNGDPIPEAKTALEWEIAGGNGEPAWCYFDNDSDNGEKYGKLYNWYAVNDSRLLAPVGWHIPSNDEWEELIKNLGDENEVGIKMKSIKGWKKDGNEFEGNNSSNFSAFPGGDRLGNGFFQYLGMDGYWWSTDDFDESSAWNIYLAYDKSTVQMNDLGKSLGFSVRCIKN